VCDEFFSFLSIYLSIFIICLVFSSFFFFYLHSHLFILSFPFRFTTPQQELQIQKFRQLYSRPNISKRLLLSPEEVFQKLSLIEAQKMYKWGNCLGFGGFGEVVEAKCKSKGDPKFGQPVAIKIQSNEEEKKRMNLEEISLLRFCQHPNIVSMYHCFEVRNEVWIVMELMLGGSLKNASTSEDQRFEESEIAYVAREMLAGIRYLHSNQIAHRDLKNQNIMLSVTGGVKLIDFGLAVDMSEGPRFGMVGSPLWMAPEMIRGDAYMYSVDIWSFIVCMCELANQQPPNRDNVKRAMFLTATVGLENPFKNPELWSKTFTVCNLFLQKNLSLRKKFLLIMNKKLFLFFKIFS
jgi:serine/threonine protein kinase